MVSRTVFKEVGYTLSAILEDIDLGELGLPDIQRPFVWGNAKVRDLFDSMYRGFPVGYLLFWVNGQTDEHRTIGADRKQKVPRLLIVDGQQRLTSLYAVLKGKPVLDKDYRERKIEIAFRPSDARFEVADAAVRRDPEFIPDISTLWAEGKSSWRLVEEFLAKLRASRELSESEEEAIGHNLDRLFDLQKYPFTALEVSPVVDEEEVAQIFVRVNSMGTPLNQADFILTLMSVFWDDGRKELEGWCRTARVPSPKVPSPFNYFLEPEPDQVLRVSVALGFRRAVLRHVYSILRGKDLETEEFSPELRDVQFAVLRESQRYVLDLQNWHEFLKCLLQAGFRSKSMITSFTGLLYAYAFYLIGRRDYELDSAILRDVISRWFFMTALTGRYTTSPESAMEQDLARLRDVKSGEEFVKLLNGILDTVFTNDYWRISLPAELATSASRSPALFAYHAALNLLDARVLFSKVRVSELLDPGVKAVKSAIESHHLFPKGYLARIGIRERRLTNQIANFALMEWSENVAVSDKPPEDYVPKLSGRFTNQELKDFWFWHALPEGWEAMSYSEFLEARRPMIAEVIRDGYSRLDRGPH